jgi:hypothetical protein
MSDPDAENAWGNWAKDVSRKLARHDKRLATHGELLHDVTESVLTLYKLDRKEKGLPPLEKPKPRIRVAAGRGARW